MLTAKQVAGAKPAIAKETGKLYPAFIRDGAGLYLRVAPGGCKSWVLRFMLDGTRRDMGLGAVDQVGLAEAREAATQARKLIREGVDPVDQRRGIVTARIAAKAKQKSFDEVAALCIESLAPGWSDPTNRQKWENTL